MEFFILMALIGVVLAYQKYIYPIYAHFRDKNTQLKSWQNWTEGYVFYEIYRIEGEQVSYSRDVKGGDYKHRIYKTVSTKEFREKIRNEKLYLADDLE